MAVAHVSIELEIKTSKYLTDDELFNALKSLKHNIQAWLDENDYPQDYMQECISSELKKVTVL